MDKSRPTLFYSWQSDHSKTRNYIERALKKSLDNIASTMEVENAPRLDKDTQDEIGAVSITSTIKNKIVKSKIFVADVSLIDQGQKGKKLTNQNVMFELGYAFGKKTEKAVILIANSDLGNANELPFDIAQNRIIFCSPKKDPKGDKLVSTLEYAIRAHLGFIDEDQHIEDMLDNKERLIQAIEDEKPTTSKSEKYFEGLYSRYLQAAPDRYKASDTVVQYGEKVVDSYQKTLSLTVELYDVINVAAEYGNANTITIAYRMIGELAAMYDNQPGENSMHAASKEYYSLLIQEISSVIIGLLSKHKRWQLIGSIISLDFVKPKNGSKKYSIETTYYSPHCVEAYFNEKSGTHYAIPTTPLIQERFVDNDRILRSYISGVMILMFTLQWYYPFVAGLLLSEREDYTPDYLTDLRSKVFAEQFRLAIMCSSVEELRTRLKDKQQQPLANSTAYWHRDLTYMFQKAGLVPIENIGSR